MDSREALVALNLIEHVGPVRVRQLLEHFGNAPALSGKGRTVAVLGTGINMLLPVRRTNVKRLVLPVFATQ